jgi:uncharacterized protein Yka (UPF0111/DUF47 family)
MTPAVVYNCGTTGEFPAVEGSSTVKRTVAKGQVPVLKNLVAQAALIKAAATLLVEEAGSEISTRRRIAASIGVLESNGDCLVRENAALFAANPLSIFSCSYEPEHLRALTSHLDDILDAIEEAAFRLSAYQWAWLVPGIPRSCLSLKTCAEGIYSAMEGTIHHDDLPMECLDLPLIAKRGDMLLRAAIHDLFSSDGEALTIFTNKEICDTLKQALSFCKSAIQQLLILESSSV